MKEKDSVDSVLGGERAPRNVVVDIVDYLEDSYFVSDISHSTLRQFYLLFLSFILFLYLYNFWYIYITE